MGGRPWSDEPVELQWYWLDDPDQLVDAAALQAIASGPAPELARDGDLLGLVAIAPDGTERSAFLALTDATIGPLTVSQGVLPLAVDDVSAAELDLAARADLASADGSIPVGGFARLQVTPQVARTRWMATGGTFFELDAITTDWAAGTVRVDDDEIIEREALGPGFVTVIALAIDEGTAWKALDLAVGPPPAGVWVQGRFLPTDEPLSGDIEATLAPDDLSPTGLRLLEVTSLTAGWGTSELTCGAPVDGPFDPNWLFDGRCTRADVVGMRIGLQVDE